VHLRVKENRDVLNVIMAYNSVYGKDIGKVVTRIKGMGKGKNNYKEDFNIRID